MCQTFASMRSSGIRKPESGVPVDGLGLVGGSSALNTRHLRSPFIVDRFKGLLTYSMRRQRVDIPLMVDNSHDRGGDVHVAVIDHVRLDVSDIAASQRFYREVLELEEVVRYEHSDRVIVQMAPGRVPPGVELWLQRGQLPQPHPTHHLAFAVTSVDALVERARRLGCRVVEAPFQIGDERIAFLIDPDGHLIELNDFKGRPVGLGDDEAEGSCDQSRL